MVEVVGKVTTAEVVEAMVRVLVSPNISARMINNVLFMSSKSGRHIMAGRSDATSAMKWAIKHETAHNLHRNGFKTNPNVTFSRSSKSRGLN